MKKIFILLLIFLTACSSATSATQASSGPSAAVNADLGTAPAVLTIDSTSGQIRRAMLDSASKWQSLRMDGTIGFFTAGGIEMQTAHEQVWIDQRAYRFRVLIGLADGTVGTLKASDGTNIIDVNLKTGETQSSTYPDFARVQGYIPPLQAGVAYPNPIWGQIGTPLSQLAFPADFAQSEGTFKTVGLETVAGREALIVEWTSVSNSLPSFKAWLDTSTGVILKLQEFGKQGGTTIIGERVVQNISYNETFEASLFVRPDDIPEFVSPTQVGSQPVVTESGSTSEKDMGELYFFLQPRQAGQSIQLVRVSGICVFNAEKCPPVEIIPVPFEFNFTISPLSWSADGKQAAFSYSDDPNGTPTRLWLFDPNNNVWTSVAEFPYIDPPFWSRDNKWIAFRVQDGVGGEDVYIVQRDGAGLKSISASLPVEGRPYILDGWFKENVIMRSALPGNGGNIYLVRAENGEARPMYGTLLAKVPYAVSPDGSLLAYDEYNTDSQLHELKIMEPDSANAVILASFTGGSLYPYVWSPDSKLIAFNYSSGLISGEPSAEVFVVSRDGKTSSSVYKGVTVGRLIFSPNGKYLLVEETTSTTGGHLFIVNLATLEKKMLEAPGLSTDYDWYAPSWRP
jgi:Tol biopolymer transport system component